MNEASEIVHRALAAFNAPSQTLTLCDVAASVATDDDLAHAYDLARRAAASNNPTAEAHLLLFEARRGINGEGSAKLASAAAQLFATFPWPVEQAAALEVAGRTREALEVFRGIGATRQVRRLEDALGIRRSAKTRALGLLSRREEQVAALLARGSTYRAIGEELGIGDRTVETHAASVYRKLGVKTRIELAARLSDQAS